jgi:rubredoxin
MSGFRGCLTALALMEGPVWPFYADRPANRSTLAAISPEPGCGQSESRFAIKAHHSKDRAAAARRPGLHFNFITGPILSVPRTYLNARRAKGYSMRTQIALQAPLPVDLLCPDCGAPVRLKLVRPELNLPDRWLDIHTFECAKCGHIHSRKVDPDLSAGRF